MIDINYIDKLNSKGLIKYTMYKYAPESFAMSIDGYSISKELIREYDLGYTLISKGEKELYIAIKRMLRENTIFKNSIPQSKFHLITSDNMYIGLEYGYTDKYDMSHKLNLYKTLSNSFKENIIAGYDSTDKSIVGVKTN